MSAFSPKLYLLLEHIASSFSTHSYGTPSFPTMPYAHIYCKVHKIFLLLSILPFKRIFHLTMFTITVDLLGDNKILL